MSFHGETIGDVMNCWLFSQAMTVFHLVGQSFENKSKNDNLFTEHVSQKLSFENNKNSLSSQKFGGKTAP